MVVYDHPPAVAVAIDEAEPGGNRCRLTVPYSRKYVGTAIDRYVSVNPNPVLTQHAFALRWGRRQEIEVVGDGRRLCIVTEAGRVGHVGAVGRLDNITLRAQSPPHQAGRRFIWARSSIATKLTPQAIASM